jgi:hypothetical protein
MAATSAAVVVATLLPQVSGGAPAESRNSVDGLSAADSQGNLHVPQDYRGAYEYLGSWAIADEKGPGAKQIHMVYASPGTVAAYRANASFPDGTVLVKEVYAAVTIPMTTGTVSHAAKLTGWFVMVRDNHGHHAGNKLWGDGWGWSWFDATNPSKTTSTDYNTDCRQCHEPARATERVYTDGYPVLER